MDGLAWIVTVLAAFEGGWFLFDGLHAFVKGDYVTPRAGPHAGQLGPWQHLVRAIGLDPRGSLVRSLHVGVGMLTLASILSFLSGASFGWLAMLVSAALGLWYLPLGTLLSIVQIVLLFLTSYRGG